MTTCVNERVAGTRSFCVGGSSPISHDPPVQGIKDGTFIFNGDDPPSCWQRAESYGREFASSEERDEYLLIHGYTRPYFNPAYVRVRRMLTALGLDATRVRLIMDHISDDRAMMAYCARMRRDPITRALRAQEGYRQMKEIWHDHPVLGARFR